MKPGTTIFLLILLLIAFGFVISDDIQLREQLNVKSLEIDDLNQKLTQANQQAAACEANRQADQATISNLEAQISILNRIVEEQNTQIATLKAEKEQLIASQKNCEAKQPQSGMEDITAWMGTNPLILFLILVAQVAMAVFQNIKHRA